MCSLIFPAGARTRISLKTSLRNDYQDLIRCILKENTWGVMGISDNPGKNRIKLSHFLLAPARWATKVPQLLLPVACVMTVEAEDESAKFIWAGLQTSIWEYVLSHWFAGKFFLTGHLNYFFLFENFEFLLAFLREIKTDLFITSLKFSCSRRPFFIFIFWLEGGTYKLFLCYCTFKGRMTPILCLCCWIVFLVE